MKYRWKDYPAGDLANPEQVQEDIRELLLVIALASVRPGDVRDQHLTDYLSKRRTRVGD